MNLVSIDLEFVAPFDVVLIVRLHSRPIISNSKDFLGYSMSIGMDPFRTLMDCFYDHVFFVSIHVFDQDNVVVSFIEYIFVEEKYGSKSL